MNNNKQCQFEASTSTSSATICKWCGQEKWQHNKQNTIFSGISSVALANTSINVCGQNNSVPITTPITPKKKADQLIRLMTVDMNIDFWQTKQCAINAVDEILNLLPEIAFGNRVYDFWQQTKQELEKQ